MATLLLRFELIEIMRMSGMKVNSGAGHGEIEIHHVYINQYSMLIAQYLRAILCNLIDAFPKFD